MASASDRITVNAGGCLYETTKITLKSAEYFQALLGETGSTLATLGGEHRAKEKERRRGRRQRQAAADYCDPNLFEDVLYFMRRQRLPSDLDKHHLEDLKAEAEFFAFEALQEACGKSLDALKKPRAVSNGLFLVGRQDRTDRSADSCQRIVIPKRQVLYIVSATVELDPNDAIHARFRTYEPWIGFQLVVETSEDHEICVANLILHEDLVSKPPMLMDDNTKEIRLCLSRPDRGFIDIVADGIAVSWNVFYWIGEPDAIPGLQASHKK
jgi:hypothetical protein